MLTTRDLREWLVHHFYDYVVEEEPIKGTYGLIWFLSAKKSFPRTLAIKTLAPEALTNPETSKDIIYLRREFRMWLDLPNHINVIPALGFDTACLSSNNKIDSVRLPIMRMPKMAGSLQDWVDSPQIETEDRLIALAQAFNGLRHLYSHGFEGHGDLKPSNILYSDIRDQVGVDNTNAWPSNMHPWLIRVADLGWADAWIDLGFSQKAFRQYLAPERLDGHVIRIKSDMFSMGVVTAELLLQCHPASNLKNALRSKGKWRRCVENCNWNLDKINSKRLKKLILNCLSGDPALRPTPEKCINEICSELQEKYGQNIAPTLELWNKKISTIAEYEHSAWAATQSINLGDQEAIHTREKLEDKIKEIAVIDFETCEMWVTLARPIIDLLEKEEGPDPVSRITQLRELAKKHLRALIGKMDRSCMEAIPPRNDFQSLQPFERFSEIVGKISDVADVDYESEIMDATELEALALSALAFSEAGLAHQGCNVSHTQEHFLSEAIRHAPEEPVLYFFRALWGKQRWFVKNVGNNSFVHDELAGWITDLESAIRLSPTWEEPKKELLILTSKIEH
jgi:serine/threonine protein kinase